MSTAGRRVRVLLADDQALFREALSDVRRSVSSLREATLAPALPEGLASLARDTSDVGIETSVAVRGTARDVSAETAESLFRSAQEGLTNVRKHSGATQARVVLDYTRPDVVKLEVHDDGGRPLQTAGGGFGLRGLGERVRGLGGGLVLEPADGRGHTLRVELPG